MYHILKLFFSYLSTIIPSFCPICKEESAQERFLCHSCLLKIQFLPLPKPILYESPHAFETSPLGYTVVANALISACSYEGNLPSLLISFKTGAGFPYAKIFGQWIAQLAPELFQLCEKIIPVPSDFYRLLSRHYNPAAMIAREASKHAHVFHKYDPFYLKKIKHIPKSRRLPFKDRITRNRNCYEISKKQAPPESVLLIDDLITTGATLNTCSNVLAHGGVKKIYILTLAKRFLQQ